MRILLAGIIGEIVMFVWTSIAHMALPLGEAGIAEIPNESPVLSAMQSNISDKTGLYIFPALGVGKNATREEKSKAMKQMQQRIAANLSGIRWSYCRAGAAKAGPGSLKLLSFST